MIIVGKNNEERKSFVFFSDKNKKNYEQAQEMAGGKGHLFKEKSHDRTITFQIWFVGDYHWYSNPFKYSYRCFSFEEVLFRS